MVVADALSRRQDHEKDEIDDNPVSRIPEDLFVRLLDLELRDAVATKLPGDKLAKDAWLALSDTGDTSFQIEKWSANTDSDGLKYLFYNNRLYVPDDESLRRQIVSEHHDTMASGHPGILATTRSVRLHYWWPGMATFIRNYVNGCATCQQFKVNTRPTKPILYPIESYSSRLFGSIGIR